MNILIITFQGDIAGSTYSISYLARGLAQRGHNVFMGCRKESLLYRMLEGTAVKLLPMTFSGRMDMKNMRQIRDAVKQYNIQVINAQSSYDRYTTVLARWIYHLNVKIVHTRRQVSRSMGGIVQNLIYVKGTDKIVAVSEGVKVSLAKGGIPENHIAIIYNGTPKEKYEGINTALSQALREKYSISDGDIVLGCISRLKNQEQILKALKLVDIKVKMIFVGIDKLPGWDEILGSYTIDHEVYFAGLVPADEVLSYYSLFTIKILASTMEGLSQSLLEAMALEVPVIATNASGNPELIEDGKNGFLFDDGDISELSRQINTLIGNEKLRVDFKKAGKVTALEKFSIENTISGFEKLFNQLIENNG